jgi:DNA-binding HxlR family transcriptional regulator
MKSYASFCPIAKAAEILAERWTLLLLRDMLQGSRRFNDLRRGVPQMSPTLLSKRLQTLEQAGLIARKPGGGNGHWEYYLTQGGEELGPVIEAIGHWGQNRVRSRLTPGELDPGVVMWAMHRHFDLTSMPPEGLVLYVEIIDARRLGRWWFIVKDGVVDLCWDDPGRDVDISLYATLLTLTQLYMGDLSLPLARKLGRVEIQGPKDLVRSMPAWFPRSKFADDNPLPVA